MSNVNHPKHYAGKKYEVIDIIEDFDLGFHLGNAVKYILRAGKKDSTKTLEDLDKARWYIERLITITRAVNKLVEVKEEICACGKPAFLTTVGKTNTKHLCKECAVDNA